jgi:hypothetical protein
MLEQHTKEDQKSWFGSILTGQQFKTFGTNVPHQEMINISTTMIRCNILPMPGHSKNTKHLTSLG